MGPSSSQAQCAWRGTQYKVTGAVPHTVSTLAHQPSSGNPEWRRAPVVVQVELGRLLSGIMLDANGTLTWQQRPQPT